VLTFTPSQQATAGSPNGYCHAVKVSGVRGSGEACLDSEAGMGPPGGWTGVKGPAFSPGWSVCTGMLGHS
jgi:hypothetical protein